MPHYLNLAKDGLLQAMFRKKKIKKEELNVRVLVTYAFSHCS